MLARAVHLDTSAVEGAQAIGRVARSDGAARALLGAAPSAERDEARRTLRLVHERRRSQAADGAAEAVGAEAPTAEVTAQLQQALDALGSGGGAGARPAPGGEG